MRLPVAARPKLGTPSLGPLNLGILLVILAGALDARADASSDLEKAYGAYVAHKYDDAEARLRALLDPSGPGPKDPDTVADARMYLGAVLLAQHRKDEAAHVFEQLLADKPDYQADPLRVSLEATDALIDARARFRDKLAAMQADKVRVAQEERAKAEAQRQKAADRLALLEKLASEEVVATRNSRWKALIPFGVGQFQNDQDSLGWVFLGTESLAVAGSAVGAGLTLYNVSQANDALTRQDRTAPQYQKRAQQAAVAGDLFAAGFFLIAAVGIVHAQLSFVPERLEVQKRALPPMALRPVVAPAPDEPGAVVGLGGTF